MDGGHGDKWTVVVVLMVMMVLMMLIVLMVLIKIRQRPDRSCSHHGKIRQLPD